MPTTLRARLVLACAVLLFAAGSVPADPLRLVPEQADIVFEIKKPAELYDRVYSSDLFKDAQKLKILEEQFDSTNARRFNQLLAYYEKELGVKAPQMLDALAGNGLVLSAKFGSDPAPALLIAEAKDEKLLAKFIKISQEIIQQELVRQESKEEIKKATYRGIEAVGIGKDFRAAQLGSALVISNKDEALKAAIDLHLDGPKKSLAESKILAEARKLLPADTLASAWINLEPARQQQGFKDGFALPNNFPPFTVLFGGYFDIIRRSPYVTLGVVPQKDGFLATIRLPRGREGAADGLAVHVPPANSGTLPLLQPKDTLASTSFYLDLGKFWEERNKLFRKEDVTAIEGADEATKTFLAGSQLSKLLTQTGAHHRIVVVNQPKAGYKKQPDAPIPAFAVVLEQRDKEFSKTLDAIIRAAALLGGGQFGLKLVEEKHGDHTIVSYRFPEDRKQPNDPQSLRFNFSPSYVSVGDYFLACSTIALAHEMIDLLEKESKSKPKMGPTAVRSRFHAAGGAEVLKSIEDILMTQAFLGLALPGEDAKKEVKAVIDLVRRLGVLEISNTYEERSFHYDLRLILGKK